MKDPARLRLWIRKYGALGLFMAGATIAVHELLVTQRRRTVMVLTACSTISCLFIAPMTMRRHGPGKASAGIAAPEPGKASWPHTTHSPRQYTLPQLMTGVIGQNRNTPTYQHENWASLVGFRAIGQEKSTHWEPIEITGIDGKGGKWSWLGGDDRPVSAERQEIFPLQPLETHASLDQNDKDSRAWKFRVEFSQTSAFDPKDLWTVHGVSVPKKGQHNDYKIIATTWMHRTKVELRSLVPPGESLGECVEIYGRQTPAVSVVLTPKREGLRLNLVQVTDDHGRPVKRTWIGEDTGSDIMNMPDPTYRYHFSLDDLHSDVKTVNLLFAIHESDFIDFAVKPTDPTR